MCAYMSFQNNTLTWQKLFQRALVFPNGYGSVNGTAESNVHQDDNRRASASKSILSRCRNASLDHTTPRSSFSFATRS